MEPADATLEENTYLEWPRHIIRVSTDPLTCARTVSRCRRCKTQNISRASTLHDQIFATYAVKVTPQKERQCPSIDMRDVCAGQNSDRVFHEASSLGRLPGDP